MIAKGISLRNCFLHICDQWPQIWAFQCLLVETRPSNKCFPKATFPIEIRFKPGFTRKWRTLFIWWLLCRGKIHGTLKRIWHDHFHNSTTSLLTCSWKQTNSLKKKVLVMGEQHHLYSIMQFPAELWKLPTASANKKHGHLFVWIHLYVACGTHKCFSAQMIVTSPQILDPYLCEVCFSDDSSISVESSPCCNSTESF